MTKPAPYLEGFEQGPTSHGDVTCTGCWDALGDFPPADRLDGDTCIPNGRPVYYRHVNIEYDEWDAYCAKCARERANETFN